MTLLLKVQTISASQGETFRKHQSYDRRALSTGSAPGVLKELLKGKGKSSKCMKRVSSVFITVLEFIPGSYKIYKTEIQRIRNVTLHFK